MIAGAKRIFIGPGGSFIVGATALMLVAVAGLTAAWWKAAAGAYLWAWLFWSSPPVGSLVLIIIHRVTGGGWGNSLAPALTPAARAVPLAAILFLPILLGGGWIYPWAHDGGAGGSPTVAALYLNMSAFVIRAVLILLLWSALSLFFAWRQDGRILAGGLGLVIYGVTISIAAVDWAMSTAVQFTSTAYAASVAIAQLLCSLAFVALWFSSRVSMATPDLGGLLLSVLLGFLYLEFMQYVVIWAGGLPEKAAWYVQRATEGWHIALITGLVLGAAVPFLILLPSRNRQDPLWVASAGALVLAGLAIFWRWQLDGGGGPFVVLVDWAAFLGLGLLFVGWMQAQRLIDHSHSRQGGGDA